jgi:hypothetical protein
MIATRDCNRTMMLARREGRCQREFQQAGTIRETSFFDSNAHIVHEGRSID